MTDIPLSIRERLRAEHGVPSSLPPDLCDEYGRSLVIAYAARDRKAAEAYAAAEIEVFGHPARVELRESVGWCVSVDLRPAIARIEAER